MLKRLHRISLFIFLVFGFGGANGGEQPDIDCQSASTTVEDKYCSEIELKNVDRELNSVYSKLRSRLAPNRKKELSGLEVKWIQLRDEICHFETEPTIDGSGWMFFKDRCLIRLTKNRIIDLKEASEYENSNHIQ